MSKEEELERFQLEYSLFNVDDVSSIEEVKSFLEIILDDFLDHKKMFKTEIKENKIFSLRARLSNYFSLFVGYEYPEYYDEDTEVVKREVKTSELFRKYIDNLLGIINDSNFFEVFKLGSYIRKMYFTYYWYLEKERNAVEMEFSGCYMNVPVPFDLNVLKEFLDSEINRISLFRSVEKKKVL